MIEYGFTAVAMAVLIWQVWRLDRRNSQLLDRFMSMTDTIASYKYNTKGGDQFLFQDLETGEVRGLVRGRSSTEDVEGAI